MGGGDEVHELELAYGAHAGEGGAVTGGGDGHLGDGGIDDAFGAEGVDEAFGDFEGAAVHADVLSHDEYAGVADHLFIEALADSFEVGDWRHSVLGARC